MTKVNGVSMNDLLARLEPRSESRPDIVERDEEVKARIKARYRNTLIVYALVAIFIVLPIVTLAMQNASMSDTQREATSHIFH